MSESNDRADGARADGRKILLQCTPAEIEQLVAAAGGKKFQAKSVRRWVLERGVDDFNKMSDLSKDVAKKLSESCVAVENRVRESRKAPDGTVKLLLELRDGSTIETVWMHGGSDVSGGGTVCISTQVGCAMACKFCASGMNGVVRNLDTYEILEQLSRARQVAPFGRIVVMGIGEPALNLSNVLAALDEVTSPDGLNISARKITISTIGIPEKMKGFLKTEKPYSLAISLHAPNDALRRELIPTAGKVTIRELLMFANHYFKQTGREVTFEYVLLRKVNDRMAQERELAGVLRGARACVNLIPYNPIPGSPYGRPDEETCREFREVLRSCGVVATIRWSKGVEADAACGQLRIARLEAPAAKKI
ncbi:MAG: 23S rRNA (adenine(2503)-C(2))-methyltransferase RlmN [Planctomycetes bacterium]|nr:23S rRNA (adenine(2503)-C(2))-methyltransferase RlmN [Planctomycetota bacterium]